MQRSAARRRKAITDAPMIDYPYLHSIDPTIFLSKLRKAKKKVKQGVTSVMDRLDRLDGLDRLKCLS